MKNHWKKLILEWSRSKRLPLVVRKSRRVRGSIVRHSTGRKLVFADNSPAQWSFRRAFEGHAYSLRDIRQLLDKDQIPFAFATKASEKAQQKFKCTLSSSNGVNTVGWKLCHIREVRLMSNKPIDKMPIEKLRQHFCDVMMPGNCFLIPKEWAGLGEIPEFIKEIRKSRA